MATAAPVLDLAAARSAAARKAVETRRAREQARETVQQERAHYDAVLQPAMTRGYLLRVEGVAWHFETREAALHYARRFNVVQQ